MDKVCAGYGRRNAVAGADMDRIEALEERVAHLMRGLEDLSDVVARLADATDRLTRHSAMLMQREAEREADGGGGSPQADQRPPHW